MAKFTKLNQKQIAEIIARTPSIGNFENDSLEARDKRIAKVKKGNWKAFVFLCTTYFPHVCELEFCNAHKEMFEVTEENVNGLTAITGFRGLAKTVLMSMLYTIFKTILGAKYVVNCSADEDLALERNDFIYNILKTNQRLLNDFPQLAIESGTELDFYLKSQTRIRARSIKQQIRGTINPKTAKRPDLIVCDDIDKLENVGNMTIGKTKMEKIRGELLGALNPSGGGRVIWLGNLTHPNFAICQFEDLLSEKIKQRDENTRPDQRKHLVLDELILLRFPLEIIKDGEIVSAWEEQYPTLELPKLRIKFGETNYLREMLGKKILEGAIFKFSWFSYWKQLPKRFKKIWLYADPAWGKKGCYRAIIVTGYDGYNFYVLAVWVRQTSNSVFDQALYDLFTKYKAKYGSRFRASMEANFGQTRHWKELDRWCEENGLEGISQYFKKIYTRENKNLRIEETETVIESGKVKFPEGQDTPTLINQYLTYPDGYLDAPDALAGCLERFMNYGKRKGIRVKTIRGKR
jgi:predicted phage terminase large subunit-like protein